ncbi:MAG: ABC transporter permease subunit [Planctomycetes bacterium]|nr:ABC transporter permease subunit [Planctomycetota bacterium]
MPRLPVRKSFGALPATWTLILALATSTSTAQDRIVVGSKNFTESGVLAEIMAQTIEARTQLEVERRLNLGGTLICWTALTSGEIDLYADYTGTGWAILLGEKGKITGPLRAFLHVRRRMRTLHDVHWLDPFGLDNTYALAMRESRAEELGITRISDLIPHQNELRAGFSIEFGRREDGYLGLSRAYDLHLGDMRALEHGLAYRAIESGTIDLMDAYSTDGKLLRYALRVLVDDRRFFPPYNAAPVVRGATLQRHPEIESALQPLAFAISDRAAQALNYVVENDGVSMGAAARAFLEREEIVTRDAGRPVRPENTDAARNTLDRVLASAPIPGESTGDRPGFWTAFLGRSGRLLVLLLEHALLTLAAVVIAALIAIPLGIAITKRPRLGRFALGAAGVIQTIPSLALLAFMIPLLGLNVRAAIAALCLYAVLPILRNTYTGIHEVAPDLVDAARGMGMKPGQILRRVQLPLASRTIMAGIRTSTVISIGVATLAAFIGAGGLGEPIVEGLYLNDSGLILSGAIPAALFAIVADGLLGQLEKWIAPRGS